MYRNGEITGLRASKAPIWQAKGRNQPADAPTVGLDAAMSVLRPKFCPPESPKSRVLGLLTRFWTLRAGGNLGGGFRWKN